MRDLADGFTLRALSRRWKIGLGKIRTWIRRGELPALNVSDSPAKPQWRVTAASVETFERQRASGPVPKVPRRKKMKDEIDYFQDD